MRQNVSAVLVSLSALVTMTACSIDVRERDSEGKADVEIKSVVGNLSVHTDTTAKDTGLPVYPGAQVLQDEGNDPGSADVTVGNSHFGMKVVAAKFESGDDQDRVLDFYRNQMKAFGRVTECRGNVDFRGPDGSEPVCREKHDARDTQLVVGTEADQRIVAVKPRGAGSEFALVHLQLRKSS